MSKERARLRAEREAARAVAEAKRQRLDARRAKRRALMRRMKPASRRRAWGLGRRSPGQRAFLIGVTLALLGLVWHFVPSWPLRIGFWLLILFLLPAVAVLTFDRKGMKL